VPIAWKQIPLITPSGYLIRIFAAARGQPRGPARDVGRRARVCAPHMPRDSPMRDPAEGISPKGVIVTGARRECVPQAFERVLSAVADELSAMAGEVSLYVCGFVATGTARVASSDVDFLTVGLPAARAKALFSNHGRRIRLWHFEWPVCVRSSGVSNCPFPPLHREATTCRIDP
jgi:hypothetical protein